MSTRNIDNCETGPGERNHEKDIPSASAPIVAQFLRLAKVLDSAGLGPADYINTALKKPRSKRKLGLKRLLLRASRLALSNPPSVPRRLHHAGILAASSYLVSAKLLLEVVARLDPGEAIFCDLRDATARPLSQRAVDGLRSLIALVPALIFTSRVRTTLIEAEAGPKCNLIPLAAFSHRIHRQAARAILKKVRPRCLVIGSAGRPPETALWAEARKRGIATVLLPYAELNMRPERCFSLCRGAFDLVLPISVASASQLRSLNPDVATKIVGFPANATVRCDGETKKNGNDGLEILYFGGNIAETEVADLLREAVGHFNNLRVRVRLHPRNEKPEDRDLFNWLEPDRISDPKHTAIADDIASATAAMAVRSTAVLDAMFAGLPFIWLSPSGAQERLKQSTIRKQNLALLEATTAAELVTVIKKLIDDEGVRKRIVDEQWSRLRAAGYEQSYFHEVRTALRQMTRLKPDRYDYPN